MSKHRKRGGAVRLARASMAKWTEQAVCLDGIGGPRAPALREEGTTEMLDGLAFYLTAQPASRPGTDDFRAAAASEALATGHIRRDHTSAAAGTVTFP